MNTTNYHFDRRWNVRQHQAAMLLGTGHTIVATAKAVRVDKSSIYRWLEDDEFSRFVEGMKNKAFDESMRVVANATTEAAFKLKSLLKSQDESIGLRAASELFNTAFKGRAESKINDINDRVKDMQARLNGGNDHADATAHASSNGSNGEENKQTLNRASQEPSRSFAGIVRDDEFADILPVIKPDDDYAPMVGHIREDAAAGHRPRRNRYAGGYKTSPGSNGAV